MLLNFVRSLTVHFFAIGIALGVAGCQRRTAAAPASATPPAPLAPPAPTLALNELFQPGGTRLEVTDKAKALDGKRVRLVGFMVEMELPPKGGFFLASHPVHCDEAGGGTADLPPDAVMVIAPSMKGRVVPHLKGPLEMTGIFQIGNHADEDGRVSAFRLQLDGPLETQVAMTHTSPGSPPSTGDRRTDGQ